MTAMLVLIAGRAGVDRQIIIVVQGAFLSTVANVRRLPELS